MVAPALKDTTEFVGQAAGMGPTTTALASAKPYRTKKQNRVRHHRRKVKRQREPGDYLATWGTRPIIEAIVKRKGASSKGASSRTGVADDWLSFFFPRST